MAKMARNAANVPPVVELEDVSMVFGGTIALRHVNLDLNAGRVRALVGENGAGKSTFTKVVSGVYAPSGGRVLVDGNPINLSSPAQARRLGVSIMHQEPSLFAHLSVAENIFLQRQPRRGILPLINRSEMNRRAREILDELDPAIAVDVLVRELSIAQAQLVELASLLTEDPRVLILDEPTASLTPSEVERLLTVVEGLRKRNVAILFISHRLSEVFAIADDITVLRDGEIVSSGAVDTYSERSLIADMVGRDLLAEQHIRDRVATGTEPSPVVLEVNNLRVAGSSGPVDFVVRAGEILGIAGLVGAGRTELARAVVGLDKSSGGRVLVSGTRVNSPQGALSQGLVYAPEDRQREGVAVELPISENITLPRLQDYSRMSFIRRSNERDTAREWIDRLRIKCNGPEQVPAQLSGGNQQKVVIAKWLATRPNVVILDEPTRGVDVGAKLEIHQLIERLAQEGLAVVMISSDLPEVLAMSDRVLVMRAGIFTAEFDHTEVTAEGVLAAAIMEKVA
ncbi:sugar ABC transporter ATP-binding protein [Salinibacterium sp. TMP30]|uniref:sugar ABC transporter ATP-binding protein n=1 Tax=Salinibacterium sp. TMP30 TaxID=3138237 RepID=UPI003138F2A3